MRVAVLIALLGTVGTAPPPSGAAGETSTAGDKPPSRAEEIAGARRKLKILYEDQQYDAATGRHASTSSGMTRSQKSLRRSIEK